MIQLINITKRFDENEVLAGFSLTIEDREHIAIMGKSGCGKTTLLRIIANLEQPDKGVREGYRFSDVAVVFQEPRLFSHLTVLENVMIVSKKSYQEAHKEALDILKKVGLEDACSLYPIELSGGMAQRVSIARAMMTESPILILDEPFSALDESTRSVIIGVVREYCLDKTLVLVTHNKADADLLSERVITLP